MGLNAGLLWQRCGASTLRIAARASFATRLRNTNWEDTWAYRVGVETPRGPITCRAGYYRDETPQPLAGIGPVFADADRQAITAGIAFGCSPSTWTFVDANAEHRTAVTRCRARPSHPRR